MKLMPQLLMRVLHAMMRAVMCCISSGRAEVVLDIEDVVVDCHTHLHFWLYLISPVVCIELWTVLPQISITTSLVLYQMREPKCAHHHK